MEDLPRHVHSGSPSLYKKDGNSRQEKTHTSHGHRASDDVQHQKRKHRRDETETERNEKKRLKKEKRRSKAVEDDLKLQADDDDDGEIWVEKGMEYAEVKLMERIFVSG